MFDSRKKFEELFKKYHSKTYHFTKKYVSDIPEAEDIVQNIFLHIWKNFSSIKNKSDSELEAVVFKTAKQEIGNFYRKKKIDTAVFEENGVVCVNEDGKSFEQEFSLKLEKISQLLKNIPERRLNFFYLHKLHNFSYSQIAKENNISKSAVEKQVSKTVQYLKANLDVF